MSSEAKEQTGMGTTESPSGGQGNRVLGGYKATLRSDRTSPEAKKHAKEVLEAAGYSVENPGVPEDEHQRRVIAGYKAALHNPRVSEAAKKHAEEYLKEHGSL